MDFNINVRENQLENFQQFIDSSKNKLQLILDGLGWTKSKVKEEKYLVNCPYDKAHRVAAKNLQEHLKCCSLRRLNHVDEDVQLSEPTGNETSSVIIGHAQKIKLFTAAREAKDNFHVGWNGIDPDPCTADRLTTTYSADERLALYDYAVKTTKGPVTLPEFTLDPIISNDQDLTYEERLEQARDLKRRRVKYKSVHTDHKSYTEVIREVIDNHMDMYKTSKTGKPRHDSKEDESTEKVVPNGCQEESRSIHSRCSTHSGSSSHKRRYSSERDHRKRHSRPSDYEKRRDNGEKYKYKRRRSREHSRERSQRRDRREDGNKRHKSVRSKHDS